MKPLGFLIDIVYYDIEINGLLRAQRCVCIDPDSVRSERDVVYLIQWGTILQCHRSISVYLLTHKQTAFFFYIHSFVHGIKTNFRRLPMTLIRLRKRRKATLLLSHFMARRRLRKGRGNYIV